ncbi:DUF3612 domain-containing protein [Pseudocolwellia sp. HL-MZ7]|uniref:DUF3612 domain-containing protein n=1 Tax=Pseudocolwellia sp. HL-MZ7 TaxID=3400627 RepID=UPI003CED42D3
MKNNKSLMRKAHFLGTKIRNLRKRNKLTMEDLSARCIKLNAEYAPSVSYLSMIERGKRVPSEEVLEIIATIFQKKPAWFLDDEKEEEAVTPIKKSIGGISGMALEPNFLFTNEILQIAIPEMLAQTGTTGRQFAHLLIRAHQEHHQNHFPDLERAAEQVGLKRLPLSLDDIIAITKNLGLVIKWFDKTPEGILASPDSYSEQAKNVVTSFFEPPNKIFVNKVMKKRQLRLKYDLAVHIGHCVLHDKNGTRNVLFAGQAPSDSWRERSDAYQTSIIDTQDILNAWRDFECSFFAGALLCPKVPFRQLLDSHGYEVNIGEKIDVSVSVAMRRMTAVSPYSHWHYFDAYSPGKLKAVYRGNGIPLPWGNMSTVEDPCHHWAIFRMMNTSETGTSSQISVMDVAGTPKIYCCESINVKDIAGNNHVLCAGIDLNPAIEAQGKDAFALAENLKDACVDNGGSVAIPKGIKSDLSSVAKILNINWVERGIEKDARMICSRGISCPRKPSCYSSGECLSAD